MNAPLVDETEKVKENIMIIQKYIRSFFERKYFHEEKKKELLFLQIEHHDKQFNEQAIRVDDILKERKQKLVEMRKEIDQSYYLIK